MVLRRIAIGPVRLDKLRRGKSRRLKLEELERLRALKTKMNHRGTETQRR
jgi:16S rRNA U516 pseudouridylate synthase RsuA-like enzyme